MLMEDKGSDSKGKTTIDTMLEFVSNNGKTDVNNISTVLGVSPSVIEGWAKILESGGLIIITNELGHMYVSPVKKGIGQNLAVSETISVQKSRVLQDVEFDITKMGELKTRLNDMANLDKTFEREVSKRLPQFYKSLNQLETVSKRSELLNRKMEELKSKADKEYKDAISKFDYENRELKEAIDRSVDTEKIRAMVEDAKRFEEAINELKVNKNRELEALRKDIDDQIKLMKKTLDDSEREIDSSIKSANVELKKELANLSEWEAVAKRGNERLPKIIGEEQARLKRMENIRESVDKEYKALQDSINEVGIDFIEKYRPLADALNSIKTGITGPTKLLDTVIQAKKDIEEINNEFGPLIKDVMVLKKEIGEVSKDKGGSEQKKLSLIDSITKRNNEIVERMKGLEQRVEKIESDINSIIEPAKSANEESAGIKN